LMEILPKNQQKLFFSDNGSTAVEIAIKVALQYFFNKDEKRTTIIAFENAFHGDTFAAMAAITPKGVRPPRVRAPCRAA